MKRAVALIAFVVVLLGVAFAADVMWEHRSRQCITAVRDASALQETKLIERSSGQPCGMLFRKADTGQWNASALPNSWLGNHNITARWMPIMDNQDFGSKQEALLALSKYCAVDNSGMEVR